MRRRIMETHKPGRATKVMDSIIGGGKSPTQVSPIDPLVGELLVANILGDSGRTTHSAEADVDVSVRTDETGTT
jgi:hypothetical protein